MSEILCKWLNEDVKLSKKVDSNNFAECFGNGYLIGELLRRYGLQDDFELFSQSGSADAKLNNFSRIEPTMALLDIKFDTNMAREIISQRPGMATRLLYQLFIELVKKTKMNLTGVAMETMRPTGAARLGIIESDMYKERLKTLVPRQIDLDFEELVTKYDKKQKQQEELAMKARYEEEKKLKKYQQDVRQQGLEKSRRIRQQQDNVMAKIKEASAKIPTPQEQKKNGKNKQELMKEKEVQSMYCSLDKFEKNLRNMPSLSSSESSGSTREIDADIDVLLSESKSTNVKTNSFIKPAENKDYVLKIRQRLIEDDMARKEREKRRRRVFLEQIKAHELQQEHAREDILVNRLMRQSQMERRIAMQLMHVRHEKELIRNNRLEKERQFTERRLKDFQEALEREAEICHQSKLDYAEDLKRTQELHDSITKDRALQKYRKHYIVCKEMLQDIVDFASKVGEYRELTERLLPPKLVREWKTLFLNSKPLYVNPIVESSAEEVQYLELEESKQTLLDEEDFVEYKNFVGEWMQIGDQSAFVKSNAVLGFILKRLNNILYPQTPPLPEPQFPAFPVKVCILGKFFAGKTSAIQKIVSTHRVQLLDVEVIVDGALQAWKCKEMKVVSSEEETNGQVITEENGTRRQQEVGYTSVLDDENSPIEEVSQQRSATPEPAENVRANTVNETPQITAVASKSGSVKKDGISFVKSDMSIQLEDSKENLLLNRAKLGGIANTFLRKGRVIPDSLLVEILVDYIRNIPDGTGWILDGFPTNVQQAKLLEKALTGYEASPSPRKSVTREGKKRKKSRLAPDPQPAVESKPPKSGLDVVVLFEVSDEVVLRRSEGRTYDPETREEFHEEFNPPPEGCYTGLQSRSKVQPVVDISNDREQAQLRLTTFQDDWPKLEKWFNRFNVLMKMDADTSYENVCSQLEEILDTTLEKVRIDLKSIKWKEENVIEMQAETNIDSIIEPVQPPMVSELIDQSSLSRLESIGEVDESKTPKEEVEKNEMKGNKSPSPLKKVKSTDQKEQSASLPKKSKRSASLRSESPEKTNSFLEESATTGEEPLKPPSPEPEPGSNEWVYVEQPLDKEFICLLLNNWQMIEETYISSCKHVFRKIRQENEIICQYFYCIKRNFVEYLKRPDEKQIYVSQWQKEYNSFPEDMRNDEDAKAELQQRFDDLLDRLWDICDCRKEDAEHERNAVMIEGWLEDHLGLLLNHYLSLVQLEIDRYQQTCKMLKDYYVSMEVGCDAKISDRLISEGMPHFSRIPLVDLPPSLPPTISEAEVIKTSSSQLSVSASGSMKPVIKTPEPSTEERKRRIPLIQRQPSLGDVSPTRIEKKKSTPRREKASEEKMSSPVPPLDIDEKFLHDATLTAFQAITAQTAADLADEEASKFINNDKANELTKTYSKDKRGKKGEKEKKSPTKPSKTQVQTPNPVQAVSSIEDISEEEQQKQIMHEKMRKEYKTAVQVEGAALKSRVESIRLHGGIVIKKLKEKAETTYTTMDNWLGKKFLEEISSIERMAEVIRQSIENEVQLQDAVMLEDDQFFIDDDLHVYKTPTPPPMSSPREAIHAQIFTCLQLQSLHKYFKEIAPSGLISTKAFTNVMMDLPTSAIGLEVLPEQWLNMTLEQLGAVISIFSINNEYMNWKEFLICLCSPYPSPSTFELFDTLNKYQAVDTAATGFITYDEYQQTTIWLDDHNDIEGNHTAETYNRIKKLKQLFFDVFSVETPEGNVLNYKDMLLYFVSCEDSLSGLLTALSILCGETLPTVKNLRETCDGQEGDIEVNVQVGHWTQVFHHGEVGHGGDHRFNLNFSSSKLNVKDEVEGVYQDLGYKSGEAVSLKLLYEHPVMRDLIDGCVKYKVKDIHTTLAEFIDGIIEEVPLFT